MWPGISQLTHPDGSPTHSHTQDPGVIRIPSTWNTAAHLSFAYSSFRSLCKKLFPPGKLASFDSLGQGYSKGSPQSNASPQVIHKEDMCRNGEIRIQNLRYFDITMASNHMMINLFEPG